MVILSHFGFNYILRVTHLFIDSAVGVHLFFVISGFLITTLLLKEKMANGNISLKRFYIRRILRILPVAYLFLIALIFLNIYYKLHIPAFDFIASFLFFKNLPIKNEPFTAHFWTLAVEEQFYLTFPFLLAYSPRYYFKAAMLIVIAIPLISIIGFYQLKYIHLPAAITFVIKVIMYSFWKGPVIILIGSLFSILTFKNIIKPAWGSKYYFLSFTLLSVAIVIQTRMFLFYKPYISEYISAIIMGYVIVLSINGVNFLSAILNNAILVKVGILSYSLYVWQELFIGKKPWQPWLSSLHDYPISLIILVKLVSLFIIALLSYYFFELKFLNLKRRFSITHYVK
ncbi:MAG: Peptidoglycan/LPS O-acetylase OafA/YrhL, contains acyltransferase and SGNH-hydrolase domain [Mucilaginibacter sp.]|nr:Peptidoglycan/LPS O-acetylase OafA/YrhL, contains acyltransferase and SGNH-hydrolase domain [Mucilaginibacter sp.]